LRCVYFLRKKLNVNRQEKFYKSATKKKSQANNEARRRSTEHEKDVLGHTCEG